MSIFVDSQKGFSTAHNIGFDFPWHSLRHLSLFYCKQAWLNPYHVSIRVWVQIIGISAILLVGNYIILILIGWFQDVTIWWAVKTKTHDKTRFFRIKFSTNEIMFFLTIICRESNNYKNKILMSFNEASKSRFWWNISWGILSNDGRQIFINNKKCFF